MRCTNRVFTCCSANYQNVKVDLRFLSSQLISLAAGIMRDKAHKAGCSVILTFVSPSEISWVTQDTGTPGSIKWHSSASIDHVKNGLRSQRPHFWAKSLPWPETRGRYLYMECVQCLLSRKVCQLCQLCLQSLLRARQWQDHRIVLSWTHFVYFRFCLSILILLTEAL